MYVFKFAWLASFGLKYSFEFFTQRRGQSVKFEHRQENTKIAAIYESGLYYINKLYYSALVSWLSSENGKQEMTDRFWTKIKPHQVVAFFVLQHCHIKDTLTNS